MPRDRSRPWIDVLVQADKAIIRKTTFRSDERVAAKYSLTADGEWIQVEEGKPYLDECVLPVITYDGDLTFYLSLDPGGKDA